MHSRKSSESDDHVQQISTEAIVLDQREQQCRQEVRQAVVEVQALLRQCCLLIDIKAYQREQAKLLLIQAWEIEGELGIQALEASQNALLKQRNQLIETLHVSFED